jgi:hypothetical protein
MSNYSATRLIKAMATELDAMASRLEHTLEGIEEFPELESVGLTISNELLRIVLERRLQRMADGFGRDVRVRGKQYRRHQPATVTYHSLCGKLRVSRASYRLRGVRNGPTIVPLELAAGLVEECTAALAFSVMQGYARLPSRDLEQEFDAAYRCLPSRSKRERMSKRLGGLAKREHTKIAKAARRATQLDDDVCSISVGMDRTAVPMIEERRPTESPTTRRKRRTKPYVRAQPHPFDVAYRMAYVATASLHNVDGQVIRTIRLAATAEEGPDEMAENLAAELSHLKRQRPALPLVVVQDGAPELWGALGGVFHRHDLRPDFEMIDRYHLNERLANVAKLIVPSPTQREAVVRAWQQSLDRNDRAIDRIVRTIDNELMNSFEATGTVVRTHHRQVKYGRSLGKAASRELTSHLNYLDSHRHQMRYATPRKRGLPIGSGATEGACKSVVGARVKRSGSRWHQDGLSACLTLRALLLSDRLHISWPVLCRHYTARVAAA